MKKILVLSVIILIVVAACSKGSGSSSTPPAGGGTNTLNCSAVAKTFATDVNPTIQSTCATNSGCHGSGSTSGPGPLLTYTAIFNARVAIRSAVASGTMPKTGSLSTAQKNSILCWVDSGAPNN